jgi:hypothetical protein
MPFREGLPDKRVWQSFLACLDKLAIDIFTKSIYNHKSLALLSTNLF